MTVREYRSYLTITGICQALRVSEDDNTYIRGKVIKQQEFYSKVHGKVCTTKNLISGHKMAP